MNKSHYVDKEELYREITACKKKYVELCASADLEEEANLIDEGVETGRFKNIRAGERFYRQQRKNAALSRKLLKMLMKIAENKLRTAHYEREDDRKDCLSMAYNDIVRYWTSYKPDQGKEPFSYFTSLVTMGSAKGWRELYPKKAPEIISLSANSVNDDQGIYTI